jgi:hypothetical protein
VGAYSVNQELEKLREKFDKNYNNWTPLLPQSERVRLTRENEEILKRIRILTVEASK